MKINLILQNPTVKKNAPKAFNQFVSLPNLKSDSFIFTGNAETKARNREEDLEMYKKRSQTNPKMAFLYNPDIPKKTREQQAKDDPTIKDVSGLAKTMGLESYLPVVKWLRGEKFDFDLIPRTLLSSAFIDTQSPQNANFLSFVQEKMPNCRNYKQLEFEYNISRGTLIQFLKDNSLRPLEAEYKEGESLDSYVFDLTDEINKSTLVQHARLNPVPSKKYYKNESVNGNMEPIYVPVTYLSKLGYSSANHLAELLRTKQLPGIYERVQTPQGDKIRALVDIMPYSNSEYVLSILRGSNPNIVSTSKLAKNLNIRKTDLDEAILNGELDIIPEYIFKDDSKCVFINLRDEKTKAFVDKKQFENSLLQAQRKEAAKADRLVRDELNSPIQRLRMKIIWSLCPMTRFVASDLAKQDGYVSSIIAKNLPDEELPPKEQVILAKYRKSYWSEAGTEEFSLAHKKASEYIELYKTKGIDAIDDPIIRNLFLDFENGLMG